MTRRTINPPTLFNSLQYGFSQIVETHGSRQLFLSGQVGVNADETTVPGGMREQAAKAVDNIAAALAAAGGTLNDVAILRIYIRAGADSAAEQQAIAEVLTAAFGDEPPASSWIIVSGLSLPEWLIEIEAQTVLP